MGGHSVDDQEIKYGLSVTGVVHPDKIIRNVGARPGDLLILTKPLGTGILNTAMKGEMVGEEAYAGRQSDGGSQRSRRRGDAIGAPTRQPMSRVLVLPVISPRC